MLSFLLWYLTLTLFGLAALPLGWTWLRHLPDRGWGLLRPLGLLLVGFTVWFLGSFGLLRLSAGSGLGALVALAGLGVWVLQRWGGGWAALRAWLREHRGLVLAQEVLFLVALAFWVWYRIHDIEGIQYTERPMDFALFRAILRGGEMPPNDPWLSGFAISYYYLGYLIMAQVTALSGVLPGVAYNLAFASLAALTGVGVFSVAFNLVRGEVRRPHVAAGMGLLAVLLVLGISNLTGIFNVAYREGMGSDNLFRQLGVNDLSIDPATGQRVQPVWWWWASSRTVSDYAPDGGRIEIIDEFPFFSFMLGDMHPHVLALPFTVLGVGLALNALRGGAAAPTARRWRGLLLPPESWTVGEGFGRVGLVLTAVVVGAMGMLNTWDFPTQFTLLAVTWALAALPALRREGLRAIGSAWLGSVGALGLGALLLYLPFYLSFSSQAEGIRLVGWSTQPHHYGLMFGLFWVALIPFLLAQVRPVVRAVREAGSRAWALAAALLALDGTVLIFLMRLNLPEDRLPLLLAAAWLLLPLALVPLLAGEGVALLGIVQAAGLPLLLGLTTGRWTLALVAGALTLALLTLWSRVRDGQPLDPQAEPSPAPSLRHPAIAGGSDAATPASVVLVVDAPDTTEGMGRAALQFALLLTGLALLLTMGSEMFFIKDGFGGRMNTVFKLYYQAWVLFALATAFALTWLARRLPVVLRLPLLVLFAALTLASMWYPTVALTTKANFSQPANWDGRFWMAQFDPDRFAAIQWLDAQPGQAVILEKPGGAYNPSESALAGWTGHSTLLGWKNHEQQWRGTYDEISRREPIIEQIYRSTDPAETQQLLDEWNVDFVAVTPQETAAYSLTAPQIDKFRQIMVPVFEQGSVIIFGR